MMPKDCHKYSFCYEGITEDEFQKIANTRLNASECSEAFTEYPFFRDGMTLIEFEDCEMEYACKVKSRVKPAM